ncbi:MAG: extracellular solute-binding protein [Clostridia bacterium]|nr:extracellular solute-binding protein [Clostridia bacterium]
MMKKRIFSVLLAGVLCVGGLAGCTGDKAKDEKVVIEIGTWPGDSNPAEQARYEKVKAKFETDFPNVTVVPNEWNYDVKSFLPQAASGQLPTVYKTYFTEIDRIGNSGYAADVTEYAEKHGFKDNYSKQINDMLTLNDGKQYMIAQSAYTMGLAINKDLFKKAGLVNEDGSLMIPETYDEVMEFSKIIKEKTGAYGFGMATKGNGGGWHMLNLAWSYGTVFEEKVEDEWKAKFGSKEFVSALKWLQEMKKEGYFPQNALIGSGDLSTLFVTDKLAMMYYDPSGNGLVEKYGMDRNKVAYASMPGGPGGRYSQMGGVVYAFNPEATPEQIDACMNWIKYIGDGPELTEDSKATIDEKYKGFAEKGFIVGVAPLSIWKDDSEVSKYISETIEKHATVDTSYFEHYMDFDKVTIKAEEPVNCQELYQVISSCMQEALTNYDADLLKIVKNAADNFEKNSLEDAE